MGIDLKKRVLDNLDQLDKSIARIALTMFALGVVYLALYFDFAADLKIPFLHDLVISRHHAFLVAVPSIFCLFQFSFVTTIGIVRLERELNSLTAGDAFSPMTHSLRFPTLFTQLFLLAAESKSFVSKGLLVLHAFLVFLFYYGTALVAGWCSVLWLVNNAEGWPSIVLSIALWAVCLVEVVVGLLVAVRRLLVFSKHPQQANPPCSETAGRSPQG